MVLVTLVWVTAVAAKQPRLPDGYSCADVREHVKRYGYRPALLWAKANGFTAEQIDQAKRCLQK